MGVSAKTYVPVLKWRQGEYQALMRLHAATKAQVMPLIEVTPPEWDFETHKIKKTIDSQLAPFASRLEKKWGTRPAFLDTSFLDPVARMIGGVHPLTYLLDGVRSRAGTVTPVTSPGRDLAHYNAVASAVATDGRGVAVRVSLDDIADPGFPTTLASLVGSLGAVLPQTDLIIDLAAKNFEPLADLTALVSALLQSSPVYVQVRSLILVGTSFPASMGKSRWAATPCRGRSGNCTRASWAHSPQASGRSPSATMLSPPPIFPGAICGCSSPRPPFATPSRTAGSSPRATMSATTALTNTGANAGR